jgi:hypothetical protein
VTVECLRMGNDEIVAVPNRLCTFLVIALARMQEAQGKPGRGVNLKSSLQRWESATCILSNLLGTLRESSSSSERDALKGWASLMRPH